MADARDRLAKRLAENGGFDWQRMIDSGAGNRFLEAYRNEADAVLAWLAEPEQVEVMHEAADRAYVNPTMIDCPRCNGRGYHHGFGEHGHDPDWCEQCGGPGTVPADDREPIRAAIAALASEGDDATGGLVTGSGG
jgi:hypothetical protein